MLSAGQFALPFHNFLGSLIYMKLHEINTLNFSTCKSEGILGITYDAIEQFSNDCQN